MIRTQQPSVVAAAAGQASGIGTSVATCTGMELLEALSAFHCYVPCLFLMKVCWLSWRLFAYYHRGVSAGVLKLFVCGHDATAAATAGVPAISWGLTQPPKSRPRTSGER